MDITKKKIIKAILIIVLIIIILLLNWLFLGGRSFSKYKKKLDSNSLTEIAEPVFTVDGASNILIDGIDDTVYEFSVRNYDNFSTSEVDLDYTIQIVNNSGANLEFILTKDGKTVSLNNNKTNSISLSGLKKQTDNYKLQIKYHNNPAIAYDITGNVQIKIEAVQAKK